MTGIGGSVGNATDNPRMLAAPAWTRTRLSALECAAMTGLLAIAAAAVCAPLIAQHDPSHLAPALRLQPPSAEFPLGTDAYGRDILSRLLHGGRVSLAIGIGVSLLSISVGTLVGLVAGQSRFADAVLMRAMDGLIAIPNILLAIAIVALWGGSVAGVLVAIAIPEVPRVARLVRSIVLSAREEPYVEAARTLGTSPARIMWRHLMPNTFGPLIVLATYICASAILLESMLSFLGASIDPQTPTWGNMMADARLYIQLRPSMILYPGMLLSATILCVNVLADRARDRFDPRSGGIS